MMLLTQSKQRDIYAILGLLLWVVGGSVPGSLFAAEPAVHYTPAYQYGESSGGRGQDIVKLIGPAVPEGSCAVFTGAELDFKQRRFGEAAIVSLPGNGCNPAKERCALTVSWKHAPAGRLNFRIKSNWTVQKTGC